jgi:hypothetical protein
MLMTNAIDVTINAPCIIVIIEMPPEILAAKLYLCCRETVNQAIFIPAREIHPTSIQDKNIMEELVINLHMHTTYSDGSGQHADIGRAALKSGLDAVLVTDHNILVQGVDAYYKEGKKSCLLLACEEIHDQDRDPQKNHLLVFDTHEELAGLADHPQTLIDAVRRQGGLCFLAHPVDPAMPAFGQTDISWEDWEATGYTGLELWNGFSELKIVAHNVPEALFYAFFPEFLPHGPHPKTLEIWDGLLARGQRVVAVGGADAHALKMNLGPIHRTIYPYEYHFSTINTHLLTPVRLTGERELDRKMLFDALGNGHCFVGNDLPAPTRGFRFLGYGKDNQIFQMGDEIRLDGTVTLQIKLPARAELRLMKDGICIQAVHGQALAHVTDEPGVYRVEAYKTFLGRRRGWIFSNPIYIR